jgi:WD40 repeat protein
MSLGVSGIHGPDQSYGGELVKDDMGIPLSFAWSPDGRFLAVGWEYGFKLYDARLNEVFSNDFSFIRSIAWSPNSSKIVLPASYEGASGTSIFDLESLSVIGTIRSISGSPDSRPMSWSPDGSQFAAYCYDQANKKHYIVIWDTTSLPWREVSLILTTHTQEWINAIAWNPSQPHLIATGNNDRRVEIWDVNQTQAPWMVYEYSDRVYGLDWNTTGTALAIAGDMEIHVWDVFKDEVNILSGHTRLTNHVQWNGNYIASIGYDGVKIWDTDRATDPLLNSLQASNYAMSLSWNKSNQTLAFSGPGFSLQNVDPFPSQ